MYLEVLVLRQHVWQMDSLMSAPLGYHDDAANLLHLGVIGGTHPVQEASNLQGQTDTALQWMFYRIHMRLATTHLPGF